MDYVESNRSSRVKIEKRKENGIRFIKLRRLRTKKGMTVTLNHPEREN